MTWTVAEDFPHSRIEPKGDYSGNAELFHPRMKAETLSGTR
jgi:hypothetical protein